MSTILPPFLPTDFDQRKISQTSCSSISHTRAYTVELEMIKEGNPREQQLPDNCNHYGVASFQNYDRPLGLVLMLTQGV
jgi:hypothetical protein